MAAAFLPLDQHLQAEGITLAEDKALLVSDEAAGKKARLSVYPFRPQ